MTADLSIPGGRPARVLTAPRPRLQACAVAALLVAAPAALAAPDPEPYGTYRVQGKAVVEAGPALDRTVDVRADVELRRGRAAGEVVLVVGARGQRCQVDGRLDATGALRLPPGQRCAVDLQDRDTRGHLDVELRAGSGRVAGEQLALELAVSVDGRVAVRTGERVQVLGVEVPPTWLPEAPVQGQATARVQGDRDRSRAASPRP